MNNIFVLGPVGAGKNTLIDKISEEHDVITLDTGRIFRYVGYKLYYALSQDENLNELDFNNPDVINKLRDKIFHLSNYIEKQLSDLCLEKNKLYNGSVEIENNKLYCRETNALLPIIAKIQMIRDKILNFIDRYLLISDKPIIMAGHNIKEIDTSKFTVVFLDVNQQASAERLYNRNSNSYNNVFEAYDEVIKRNSVDKIDKTKKILPYLYNYIYIDTTNKSIEQIYKEFMTEYNKKELSNARFIDKQGLSESRDNFEWLLNPILEPIRMLLKDITKKICDEYPFVGQNDLIYQTLIILTSHDINELYIYDDMEYLNSISECLNERNKEIYADFYKRVEISEIKINYNIVMKELLSALTFLQGLYKTDEIKKVMTEYNKQTIKGNLTLHNGLVNEVSECNIDSIDIKVIDSETSQFISKYCHYLHTPRTDEFIAYGAFRNNDQHPIAYVSYSKQDRSYKKQLLYNLGIEPQNSIEMTRAWCANSAPINIMSYIFQYSINDILKRWKDLCKENLVDKQLQAITTTINPNLGFKASSFLGCNFIPIAMRPAKFTFVEKNGIIKYETRRRIESSVDDMQYIENKIQILPLNELILCLDRNKIEAIKSCNILLFDNDEYDTVLKNKCLVKKEV